MVKLICLSGYNHFVALTFKGWNILVLWGFTEKSDFYGKGMGGNEKPKSSRELPKMGDLDSLQV